MKRSWLLPAALWLMALCSSAAAEDLIMVRVHDGFPETMSRLQQEISKQGYKVSRVQRVDIGLTSSGYKTAEYRLVFFGKPEEIEALPKKYPNVVPYLPLQMIIFAEGDETLLLAMNPHTLMELYDEPGLRDYVTRWEKDVREIMERVQGGV
jgi:uncharacterized protein (DUF302 family)